MLQSDQHADIEAAMNVRYAATKCMLASNDTIEEPAAFAAQRAPVWRGR